MATIDAMLTEAYDTVKDDVIAQLKQHPQYGQVVEALVAKAIQSLITIAA